MSIKETLELLNSTEREYESLIFYMENSLNNIENLSQSEILEIEKNVKSIKSYLPEIEAEIKKLSTKVYNQRAMKDLTIKNKLSDKKSFEYNEVLLYQGKPAKAIKNLEELAKKGDVRALLLIGKTFLNGVIGFYNDKKMKDVGLGLRWLILAYKKGSLEAGYLIAVYEKSVFNIQGALKIFKDLEKKDYKPAFKELYEIYKNDPEFKDLNKALDLKSRL